MPETPKQTEGRLSVIARHTPLCGTRVCADCRKETEVVELLPFYDAKGNVDRLLCLLCHGKATVQKKRAELEGQMQATFKTLMVNVQRRANTANVCDFTDALVKRFGGIEGLAEFAHQQIIMASNRNGGSKTVIDAIAVIAKLLDSASARAPKMMPVAGMSDEDLARFLSVALLKNEGPNVGAA